MYKPSALLVVATKDSVEVSVNQALQGLEQTPLPRGLFDDSKVAAYSAVDLAVASMDSVLGIGGKHRSFVAKTEFYNHM